MNIIANAYDFMKAMTFWIGMYIMFHVVVFGGHVKIELGNGPAQVKDFLVALFSVL